MSSEYKQEVWCVMRVVSRNAYPIKSKEHTAVTCEEVMTQCHPLTNAIGWHKSIERARESCSSCANFQDSDTNCVMEKINTQVYLLHKRYLFNNLNNNFAVNEFIKFPSNVWSPIVNRSEALNASYQTEFCLPMLRDIPSFGEGLAGLSSVSEWPSYDEIINENKPACLRSQEEKFEL